MIEVRDQKLECTKCGNQFVFTETEARAFNEKGLTNVPKKCPACRAKDRTKKENRTRFEAQCSECGTTFEIPFEPARSATGELLRPMYCLEHFERRQDATA